MLSFVKVKTTFLNITHFLGDGLNILEEKQEKKQFCAESSGKC
jgi:hypothetical protein